MSKFKKFTQLKKNSKEEVDALYEILGIDKKDKNIEKINPDIPRIAELLEWNAEIEALEEGKASGHTLRVAYLSKKMAEELGLDDDEVKNIYLGALFHDTGKHLISPKILSKPGPLTDEEYEIVKTHVTLAIDLVEDVVPVESLAIIRGHHERMDGSGYPFKSSIKTVNQIILLQFFLIFRLVLDHINIPFRLFHEVQCTILILEM